MLHDEADRIGRQAHGRVRVHLHRAVRQSPVSVAAVAMADVAVVRRGGARVHLAARAALVDRAERAVVADRDVVRDRRVVVDLHQPPFVRAIADHDLVRVALLAVPVGGLRMRDPRRVRQRHGGHVGGRGPVDVRIGVGDCHERRVHEMQLAGVQRHGTDLGRVHDPGRAARPAASLVQIAFRARRGRDRPRDAQLPEIGGRARHENLQLISLDRNRPGILVVAGAARVQTAGV